MEVIAIDVARKPVETKGEASADTSDVTKRCGYHHMSLLPPVPTDGNECRQNF